MQAHDQIFQNINLGLMVLDRDLRVRAWNRWMELHSSLSFAEVEGKSILQFYPHLAQPEFSRFFKSVLSFGNYAFFSQKLHRQLIPMKNPHPSVAHIPYMQQNCTAGPIRNDQRAIESIYITIQDVTEYVMYEHRLVEMSRLDPMTRLLNRSHLEQTLSEEMSRAQRYGTPLSVLMIDIDFFKSINDTYGHVCGDQVIKAIANLLKDTVRRIDVVGRYGGEEFCCVLPETASDNAVLLAERLRGMVEEKVHTFGAHTLKVTISVGVAELSPGRDTLERLVNAADDALYRSKHQGRNRVTCAALEESAPHPASASSLLAN
ncbi:GGDEF domain-containing protein [Geomonas sp. Red32]|uniref:sensor domain-containing diguanylate cyclase n=1 Tax=Geomonas sp. Red32 TaxID=2912856 RepID=UPI00202CCA77|nr:sensor domain-containing diguanylate cyclase [Geomonas sp. Red32]MCM0082409.1 GGDEF domain-containing protein [Geomonas sp. Red32]